MFRRRYRSRFRPVRRARVSRRRFRGRIRY